MHLFKAIPHQVILAAALGLTTLCCGGGKIPATRYYALDLPAAPMPAAANTTPEKSLAVRGVTAADPYTQDRIVYRPSRQEVGFYEYHRWAADPRESVHNALLEKLKASGLFKVVGGYDGRMKADYVLQTRIERLEEVDFESGVKVYVELAAELLDASDNSAIWAGEGTGSGVVTSPEVSQVVAEMSKATADSLDEIVEGLRQALREQL